MAYRQYRTLISTVAQSARRTGLGSGASFTPACAVATGSSWSSHDHTKYLAAGAIAGLALLLKSTGTESECSERRFTLKEVAEKDGGPQSGGQILVTFKGGVYDITEFVASHPGGQSKIRLAAGKSLEPFWQLFPFHLEQAQVSELLKGMRVGALAESEQVAQVDSADPFSKDPARHPALILHSTRPCNAEVPAELLTESYVTPASLWYIRNHHPVPLVKEEDYKLKVDGRASGGFVVELSLAQLRALPAITLVATMQCSGNRRGDMNKVSKASGTSWGQGAISTAEWTGPRLSDVLRLAGVHSESEGAKHACFQAMDEMQASVPCGKALERAGDAILALEMNGEPLPREHGFPVRAVVPGYVGVRNVKWVNEVRLSQEEALGDWQRGLNYKILPPGLSSAEGVDLSTVPAMQEASVFSGITGAEGGEEAGLVDAKGWAWAGGGRGIARVDISADGGKTWKMANIVQGAGQPAGREWAWVFWEASGVVADGQSGEVEVISRAIDKCYNSQPENASHIWNMRGLGNNSWFRRKFQLE
mmetsp:Transcript_57196/g.129603  ORF Transcript_57196/g.129603 Transcript_57196/m.129603 type:complete len:536 (-) Transcript_57196:178-1785(-)|eukprot:CAMPEP_0172617660 /NCGR_PEP_ID=MMETSP1068-20121228/70919_1 /TAXON_ID=35684 /ORGANISM="Pseudopedinella elastica, Strain CCMP716" /LENGTH=535 /DNA_ID=CAMNT_0013423471 /DNA_START=94 /DNA_END=1701 /DNA_ORIENTATION=-